jgi:hypothetical protein
MDATELRPLALGELLDRTFRLYRNHFWLFAGIMAIPSAVSIPFTVYIFSMQGSSLTGGPPGPKAAIGLVLFALIFLCFFWAVYSMAIGAATYAVSEAYLGQTVTVRAAYGKVRGSFWRILGVVAIGLLRACGYRHGDCCCYFICRDRRTRSWRRPTGNNSWNSPGASHRSGLSDRNWILVVVVASVCRFHSSASTRKTRGPRGPSSQRTPDERPPLANACGLVLVLGHSVRRSNCVPGTFFHYDDDFSAKWSFTRVARLCVGDEWSGRRRDHGTHPAHRASTQLLRHTNPQGSV